MNDLIKRDPVLDALEAIAEQESGRDGAFLKFKRGRWSVGSDGVEATDQAYVAPITRAMRGFIRWESSKPVQREMHFLLEPEVRREQIGDMDAGLWPIGPSGPQDPWQHTYELALAGADGEKLIYSTTSFGGRRAIGTLLMSYVRHRRQTPGELPVVKLTGDSYRHNTYGMIERPIFAVVGWQPDPDFEAPPEAPPVSQLVEDEIPF